MSETLPRKTLHATTLHIVERAYQGTLEEQDDQALWLVGALNKAGLEQSVLLRGPAVAYAVPNQTVSRLHIGGLETGHPPRLDLDLARLMANGVTVNLVREDAEQRGIPEGGTLPGIAWIARAGMAELFQQAERILAW